MNDMTINGESNRVYMNMHDFEKRKEVLNMRKKVLQAEQERVRGKKTLSVSEARKLFKEANKIKGEFVEGGSTMCDVLDKVENKGRQEGKIEGEIEAYRKTAKNLFENGASFELVIASIPDLPKDEIQKIFDEIFKK